MNSHSEKKSTFPKSSKTAANQKANESTRNNFSLPILATGTNLVTLAQNNGFNWAPIVDNDHHDKTRLNFGQPILCFPQTQAILPGIPLLNIRQSAEQSANFMRTHLPDVDIPSDIIRDEVVQDAKVLRSDNVYNPFEGNVLEPIHSHTEYSETSYLCFPSGGMGTGLNLSPLISKPESLLFKPISKPKHTFMSPIQQISSLGRGSDGSYLAVRTFGASHFFQVKFGGSTATRNIYLENLGQVDRSQTNDERVVYMTPSGPGEFMLATIYGGVYRCFAFNGTQQMTLLRLSNGGGNSGVEDGYQQIRLTEFRDQFLHSTKRDITIFDVRSPSSSLLYESCDHTITSISIKQKNILSFSTTEHVQWIDTRMPGRPLLAYVHGRQPDRTLHILDIPNAPDRLALASRKNELITIYDVSSSEGSLKMKHRPFCLPVLNGFNTKYTGRCFIRSPASSKILFSLSQWGSLHALSLCESNELTKDNVGVEWPTDMEGIKSKVDASYSDAGLRREREKTITDFSEVYDNIFRKDMQAAAASEKEYPGVASGLAGGIASYWHRDRALTNAMLTTYDVASAAGAEYGTTSGTDFLIGNNSKKGYQAATQGLLGLDILKVNAPWHFDLRPSMCRLDSEYVANPSLLEDSLRRYDLATNDERPINSTRWEAQAKDHLIRDLTLASDIYAAHEFSKMDTDHDLDAMTEALSLGDEPSPISFHYLRPIIHPSYVETEGDSKEEAYGEAPIGARLLLKEWDVGTDPKGYKYRDPYSENKQETPHFESDHRHRNILFQTQPPPVITRRPPTIVTSSQIVVPTIPTQPIVHAQRMVTEISDEPIFGLLQTAEEPAMMSSTQILPGPYGGRVATTSHKKKIVKKRMGGF